jgi:uncharacterized membrane protein
MSVVHFHLLVLHFPIALLVVGALLQLGAVITGNGGLRTAARISLVLGALGAVVTAWSGEQAEEIVEESLRAPEAVLERHEEIGMWAGYVAAVLLLVQLAAFRVRSAALEWGVTVLAIVTAVLIGLAGFTGGKIRHADPLEGSSSGGTVEPFVPIPEGGPHRD